MIISASRRTDIPACYPKWFVNRLQEGFVYSQNPMNPKQIKKVDLSPKLVDGIVLWTKNPEPLFKYLPELEPYAWYMHCTVTAYGQDVEPHVPPQKEVLQTIKKIAKKYGSHRIIWRYDPVFVNDVYTIDLHVKNFEQIARELFGYTHTVILSYLAFYRKIATAWKSLGVQDLSEEQKCALAQTFSNIANAHNITVESCAQILDLSAYGVKPARCIDADRLSQLSGKPLKNTKDKHQRPACTCRASIDIGIYNTCTNGCLYCYANHKNAAAKALLHDVTSPLLIGRAGG